MTMQISVRIPDELVAFIDGETAAGRANGRGDLVTVAVERERRRRLAEHDAAIYSNLAKAGGSNDPDDWDSLARHASDQPTGLED